MGQVVLLSLTSALNPTLITATTVMLLLPNPFRLMLGYWLGAMAMSIPLGLLIEYSLAGSSIVDTTQDTLSPAADIVLGGLALMLAIVIGTGRDGVISERRARRRTGNDLPRWQRTMSGGSARTTFVIGALLTLPGASYIAGLTKLSKLDYSPEVTVLVVIAFNLVMLVLLETALVAFRLAPDSTPAVIERTKEWAGRHARRVATCGFAAVAAALVLKGIIGLAS